MDKIKKSFQNMSLKKSLLLLAVFCLSVVSILSIITILIFSNIWQEILDTRPIIVSDYTNRYDTENAGSIVVVPHEYTHGELSKENQIYYWTVTILMAASPILYVIIVSVIVAKFYYKLKLQTPLKSLKNEMHHISEQNLGFQIEYSSDDELGKLCDTFEYMKSEIYKSNCKMWDMLQERKALTASVSHDLRTPITVINGYLDYLNKSILKGTLTNDVLQTTIQNMTGAAKRLERYVDCVKDIQKIEDIEIKKEFFDLKEFIVDMSSEFSLLAEQHKKHLEIHDLSEIIYTKAWVYMESVVIRLICCFLLLVFLVIAFAFVMRSNNCVFPFWVFVFITILYAGFLGLLGLILSQAGGNVIIGYLSVLGYWSFCQLPIITKGNMAYLFPVVNGIR